MDGSFAKRLDTMDITEAHNSATTFDIAACRARLRAQQTHQLHLDAERLALVCKKTQTLKSLYHADVERFLLFLDSLLEPDA